MAELPEGAEIQPGKVLILDCGSDGACAWVRMDRDIFGLLDGAQLLERLDGAKDHLRERYPING